jgi:hypothetical protein
MRTAGRSIAIPLILAVFAVAPAVMRASNSGALGSGALCSDESAANCANEASKDTPDEASRLIVTGDFNRDGIADMAEVVWPDCKHTGAGFLSVSLGQRDGTFKHVASNPAVGHDPQAMVVGDFNGDGNPDLIVGDGDGSLTEFRGDGTGKLVPVGAIARFSSIASIAMSDFNHDGILDLAVSDPSSSSVTILLGSGNGSFQHAWSFPLPMKGIAFRVAAADFNGDGIIDLAVTNDEDAAYEIMLGNGNGTFTYAPALSNVKDPNSHCPA